MRNTKDAHAPAGHGNGQRKKSVLNGISEGGIGPDRVLRHIAQIKLAPAITRVRRFPSLAAFPSAYMTLARPVAANAAFGSHRTAANAITDARSATDRAFHSGLLVVKPGV